MKVNHRSIRQFLNDHQYSDEEVAGFEKFNKKQRSMASPIWKSQQKTTRYMKEIWVNSNL